MAREDRWEALARCFRHFAVEQARGRSPLYGRLADDISGRPEVASVLLEAPPDQRRPTLLFAAVHDLLLGGVEHPLASYYPSVGGRREPDEALLLIFHDFCAAHDAVLRSMVSTRRTQTNEVRRSAALLPALQHAAQDAGAPFALVEIGTSAGLNLLMDRFAYRYDARRVGPPEAMVVIDTHLRSGRSPPILDSALPAERRIGVDLHPLDVRLPADARWLRACVWPDDLDRLRLLDAAVGLARRHPPELVAGHALQALPDVAERLPDGLELCVFHSSTLAYFSGEERRRFIELLRSLSHARSLWWISLEAPFIEPFDRQAPSAFEDEVEGLSYLVALSRLEDGRRVSDQLLGRSDPHGKWLEWIVA
ncbi:MAG: DUF2332 domain-containing protein [Nitriliruptorales bacterium]